MKRDISRSPQAASASMIAFSFGLLSFRRNFMLTPPVDGWSVCLSVAGCLLCPACFIFLRTLDAGERRVFLPLLDFLAGCDLPLRAGWRRVVIPGMMSRPQ